MAEIVASEAAIFAGFSVWPPLPPPKPNGMTEKLRAPHAGTEHPPAGERSPAPEISAYLPTFKPPAGLPLCRLEYKYIIKLYSAACYKSGRPTGRPTSSLNLLIYISLFT